MNVIITTILTFTMKLQNNTLGLQVFAVMGIFMLSVVLFATTASARAGNTMPSSVVTNQDEYINVCQPVQDGYVMHNYLAGQLVRIAEPPTKTIIPPFEYAFRPSFEYDFGENNTGNYLGQNWPDLKDIWDNNCVEKRVDYCHAPSEDLSKAKIYIDMPASSWAPKGHVEHAGDFLITNNDERELCEAIVGDFACADGIDNDGDSLTDSEDPGCWTDPNDETTYDPFDDDEVHGIKDPPVQEENIATIIAQKIVCDSEEYLPDWALDQGNPVIDEDTVNTFLDEGDNRDHCRLIEWDFEWAPPSVEGNPGDNEENVGEPWTTFSGTAHIEVEEDWKHVWVREVPDSNYIPFTGKSDTNLVSAEMYCHIDSFHYDNYERIDGITVDETYYCVAWNVPIEPQEPEMCVISSDETTLVDGVPSTLTWVHPNWTKELASGEAEWIWDDSQDPQEGETVTFTKTFNVDSSPTSATLKVATDNSYVATLNGTSLSCDGSGNNNFSSIDTCLAPVVSGLNTLTFVATNNPPKNPTNNEHINPAGLIYELTIDGSACSAVPEEPDTFPITGNKWNDKDGDGVWDDTEFGIENWGIVVKPMTLQPFDTLFVPATSNSITTSTALTDGHYYLVEVSGTYTFANWSPYGIADAEWSYRSAPYTPDNTAGWVKGEGYFQSECGLDLQMNGCFDWGALNETDNHLYKTVIQGDGTPLDFSIYDNQYSDNEGGLNVEIYDVTDYITYTNEDGQYSVDVKDGDYQIVEIMQEGWEQTHPTNPSYYHVTVPNNNEKDYDFGNSELNPQNTEPEPTCLVDGYVYDVDDTSPLVGWTVGLDGIGDGTYPVGTDVTDGDGYYCIEESDDEEENQDIFVMLKSFFVTTAHAVSNINTHIVWQSLESGWSDAKVTVDGTVTSHTSGGTYDTSVEITHVDDTVHVDFYNEKDQAAIRTSGGGGALLNTGNGNNDDDDDDDQPDGDTRGASDSKGDDKKSSSDEDKPEGEVQGEQTTIVPAGAPNAGAGGMSPTQSSTLPLMALFGMLTSLAVLRVTKVNG